MSPTPSNSAAAAEREALHAECERLALEWTRLEAWLNYPISLFGKPYPIAWRSER